MAGTRGRKSSTPRTPPSTKSKKRSAPESSPANGDATNNEPKRKRGRPSKAEIAAREARQSQASENGTDAANQDNKMEGVIAEATKSDDAPVTPPATKKKRGRPSKVEKEKSQISIEESMDAAESEKKPESNGYTDNAEVKETKENSNGVNDSGVIANSNGPSQDTLPESQPATEKNAFDLVKSGLDEEAPKVAENEKKPEVSSDDTKPAEPLSLNGTAEKEPEAGSEAKASESAIASDSEKEVAKPKGNDEVPVFDITVEDDIGDDVSVKDFARQEEIPSSILEKGIIYFFFRARVNIEEPQGIEDVARSYIVLRPLPIGAKITEGALSDDGNARLLALPKKKLPQSGKDKFLVFVEKKDASLKELRGQLSGAEYATQTSGTSTAQAATPFAEGIYAITSTERESHLAYHISVPDKVGEIQNELGLQQKGSFIVSAKNPKTGDGNVGLQNPAKYPDGLQKKFRGLKWMPLIPSLLDYENTQFLVIGEGAGHMGAALDEMSVDKKDAEKEKPGEEVEKLVEEDHDRIAALKDDDPIFADLGLSAGEYPKLTSTWSGASV